MRRMLYMIAAFAALLSCTKEVSIDHKTSAEFPKVESLSSVSVLFASEGSADLLIPAAGTYTRQSLTVVSGNFADTALPALLEETFWKAPSRQWIIHSEGPLVGEALSLVGFVNCLRDRGLPTEGEQLFASPNVYDKISSLRMSPLGFTVRVREEAQ